ncbi:DUF4189 domain-containing protein [Nocardia sp. NPDC049190]|uniref:DUF4189 domain-containing protein n=1 Tax=Nocardia sp. NPDC049190 TaxID=3155650 RepID=UPI0033D65158
MLVLGRAALGAVLTSAAVITTEWPAAATGRHGTAAVSRSTGKVVAAIDEPSWVTADAAAIRDCGHYDCQIMVRFVNACAAVARGADVTVRNGRCRGWRPSGSP